jgi:predicted amidohydrolase
MREARIALAVARRVTDRDDPGPIVARAKEQIARAARDGADLVLFSEIFATPASGLSVEAVRQAAQTVPGPLSEELGALARKHGVYVAFGLYRREGPRVYNGLVLLDRAGKLAWTYDKTTPLAEEMIQGGITPGAAPTAFDADFGRLGAAICFDINFLELGELYQRQNVELLLFSSAFPGGRLLDHWAIRYGMAVAACTWYTDNRVIDCTGATVGRTSDILPCTTTPLNLNRRVVHMDGNLGKIEKMLARYPGEVLVEDMRLEATCVITSLKQGLEVGELVREFEVEPLAAYFDRVRHVRQRQGGMGLPAWLQGETP